MKSEAHRNEKTLWQARGLREQVKYLEIKCRPHSPETWGIQDPGSQTAS